MKRRGRTCLDTANEWEEIEKDFEDFDTGAPRPVNVRSAQACRDCCCWDRTKPPPAGCPGRKLKAKPEA